ncbi:hypothetical protein QBC35DRAFT_394816 [Podospora australis]|uniref:Secreted LysM effector LysM C-terminal domain-containing protein n=1 Tax=Podospora australis TaxID=1536484 RepID=A0AAN6WJX1_9PEZI|nr:hypothetical protein QBC35DRAFT_394816 [Podospora australis]
MQLSTLLVGALSLLAPGASAWSLTGYMDVQNCNVQSQSNYRIIEGASNLNSCFNFQQSMPGTSCRAYSNGGLNYGTCTSPGPAGPISVRARGTCRVYAEPNCQGTSKLVNHLQCAQLPGPMLIIPYQIVNSFTCTGK